MGLAVTVGNPCIGYDEEGEEHYRRQFAGLAAALAAEGHAWTPPDGAPPTGLARPYVGSFPYSCLHYLRRAYALHVEGQPVTPVVDGDLKDADGFVDDAASMLDSHLLCHSDCEGFYVPVPIADPVFLDEGPGGGMVGSSHGLLDELRRVAPRIGVRLDEDGSLSDAEADRLGAEGDPFETEQMVWLTLHEACRVSIASGHPIVFH
ncbi:hypothetical protein [Dactylosporangium sp. NPDC006015]|uniref:hypothetical protein n=1 Tax=Dactylosporangium sp. NPDC006015 TaxID=3154576 RepID=UPI0033B14A3E